MKAEGMIIIIKAKIGRWLEDRGWTQRELSEALNYNEGALSRAINGEEEPSKFLMKKLMWMTGLDLALFDFDREKSTNGNGKEDK